MKRKRLSLKTQLASALRELFQIPYDDAKQMTADQIISLVQFDHGILHAVRPIDEHWNITPRLIQEHRRKSTKDTGTVAKVRRLTASQEEFRRRVLARECGEKRAPKQTIPSRPFRQARDHPAQNEAGRGAVPDGSAERPGRLRARYHDGPNDDDLRRLENS